MIPRICPRISNNAYDLALKACICTGFAEYLAIFVESRAVFQCECLIFSIVVPIFSASAYFVNYFLVWENNFK